MLVEVFIVSQGTTVILVKVESGIHGTLFVISRKIFIFRGASLGILMIYWMLMRKKGRIKRPNWFINELRHAILDYGLLYVQMEGRLPFYLVSKSRQHSPCVFQKRLDYALSSEMWFQIFPNAKLLLHIVIIPSSLIFIPL